MGLDWKKAKYIVVVVFFYELLSLWPSLESLRYSIDDYLLFQYPLLDSNRGSTFLSQGRLAQYAIHYVYEFFGVSPLFSHIFHSALSWLLMGLSAFVVTNIWTEKYGRKSSLPMENFFFGLVAVLMHAHMSYTEQFMFRQASATVGLCSFLSAYGLWAVRPKRFVLGLLLMTFSISTGPVTMNALIVIVCFSTLLIILNPSKNKRQEWRDLGWKSGAVIASGALYVLSTKMFFTMMQTAPESRWGFLDIANLSQRLSDVGHLWMDTFLNSAPFSFLAAPWLTSVVASLLLWSLAKHKSRIPSILVFVLTSILWMGVHLVAIKWQPNLRTMNGLSFWYAGLLLTTYLLLDSSLLRKVVLCASTLLAIGFMGSSNRLLVDQSRLNFTDRLLAQQVFERLQDLPGYYNVQRMLFSGSPHQRHQGLTSEYLETNYSPWNYHQNYRAVILSEVSGKSFSPPLTEDYVAANKICSHLPPWPAKQSVHITGNLGLVCFGN